MIHLAKMNYSAVLATFSDPSVFLKSFEFILTIISLSVEQGGLVYFKNDSSDFFFGGTMVLTVTVSGLLLILYMLGQQRDIQKTYFELSFNAIAALFQLSTGIMAISEYSGYRGDAASHANTAGSFCIITAAVYVVDCYYAYVNYRSLALQPDQSPAARPAASQGGPE